MRRRQGTRLWADDRGTELRTPADLTVLIVDDNDYARAIAETSLKKLGVGRILEAADAAGGLDVLNRGKVDLVLLDWYMPEINGAGFVRLAQSHDVNVPIIITTAYATKQNFARMRELGLEHVLVKPFEPVQLHRMMAAALARSRDADLDGMRVVEL